MYRELRDLFWGTWAYALACASAACGSDSEMVAPLVLNYAAPLEVHAERDFVIKAADQRVLACSPPVPALDDGSYTFPDDLYYPDVIDSELRDYPELAAV